MPPTPEATRAGYFNLWSRAKIRPQDAAQVKVIAQKIMDNKERYQKIEKATGVPWFMIGPIHNRESSLRFNAHLHCGTSLQQRTTLVPKGRPKTGSPPFTWEESAIDALTMAPHSLNRVKDWTVERILYETERYNGWGYLGKGNSPYVWAGTTEYRGGKYIADHVYSAQAWDKQLGCAALLKQLAEMDASVAARLGRRQNSPPPDIETSDRHTEESVRKARLVRNGAGGTGTAGAGTKATVETPPTTDSAAGVTMGLLLPLAIALCVAVFIGAVVHITMKRQQAKDNALAAWRGTEAQDA